MAKYQAHVEHLNRCLGRQPAEPAEKPVSARQMQRNQFRSHTYYDRAQYRVKTPEESQFPELEHNDDELLMTELLNGWDERWQACLEALDKGEISPARAFTERWNLADELIQLTLGIAHPTPMFISNTLAQLYHADSNPEENIERLKKLLDDPNAGGGKVFRRVVD